MKTDIKELLARQRKKVNRSSVRMGIFLIIFALFLGGGMLFAEETVPETPWNDDLYSVNNSDALLLCDSDKDESVYIPASVVSEQSDQSQTETSESGLSEEPPEPPEEEDEPEEEEEEEEPEPEQEPQVKPTTQQNNTPNNNEQPGTAGGGEEGGSTDEIYFTTTIKDKETVTDPSYSFSVKHNEELLREKKLTAKDVIVKVNGVQAGQFNISGDSVQLKDGENTIRVEAHYVDADGNVAASPFKDYTVTLNNKDLVISTSLVNNTTVDKDTLGFTASASYKGEAAELTVELNGSKVSGSGDQYRVRLKEGANTILLKAEHNGTKKEETYTITYTSSGQFGFETDLPAENITVTSSAYSFHVWMYNTAGGLANVTLNGQKVNPEADKETYNVSLQFGNNVIRVYAKDPVTGQTQQQQVTITLVYEAPEEGENYDDPDNPIVITTNLDSLVDSEGRVEVGNNVLTLVIDARDSKGDQVYGSGMKVTVNGAPPATNPVENEKTSYTLDLTTGENMIQITLQDEYGHYGQRVYYVTYTPTDGPIGRVVVSVEATTLSLGYLVPPTYVDIYAGEDGAAPLCRALEYYGYTWDNTSKGNSFYLARIYKEGLVSNYIIPDALLGYLTEGNAQITGTHDPNSLGEKDFYGQSGWNIAVNDYYINHNLDQESYVGGEHIAVRFTLNMGYDIGGLNGAEGEYPEKFIEPYLEPVEMVQ